VKSAAWELGSQGITANLVCPPATDTGWMTDAVKESVLRESPLQHVAVPRDIADVIVFLASEHARWITGQRIRVS
jgi:3-oxoacyl-[acyl-carrier protein] reductase